MEDKKQVQLEGTIGIAEGQACLLSQLPVTGRRLHSPLAIYFSQEEVGEIVVTDNVIHLYGVGETPEEALADYEAMLLDTYEQLRVNSSRLSPRLERQLDFLNSLLA